MQIDHLEYTEKKAAISIQRTNSWYKTVFEASPSGILIMDKDGIIIFCSNMACQIMGVPEAQLISKSILEIVPQDQHEDLLDRTKKIVNGDESYSKSGITLTPGNGAVINMEGSATLYRNEQGEKAGVIMIFNDITERVQQAKIIQQQIEDLNSKNEELKKIHRL